MSEENKDRNWQPIDVVSDQEAFEAYLQRNMPREAEVVRQNKMDRRTFMKLMGASMALTGVGLTGCSVNPPDDPIIPYVRMPEEIVPGRPLYFASSMVLGGFATGLLIETHEGRPTRVDGNPRHPASLGGSNSLVLGSILELYNPERATTVLQGRNPSTWEDFLAALQSQLSGGDGSGVSILTETITSPTFADQLTQLVEMYPEAKWYQYEPVSRDSVVAGANLAFGEPVNTVYQFENADVIVSLDSDFLSNMPGSVRYAREFATGRKINGENATMNRLYAVESSPNITGAAADHQLTVKASEVEVFARALADALGIDVGNVPTAVSWNANWFNTVVDELRNNSGASVVVAGMEQTPVVHALAHAINVELGNVGNTVVYTDPAEANAVVQSEQLAELTSEMERGRVESLFILGGDPVFTAPTDIAFGAALESVPFSVHLSLYANATSELCEWLIPQTHYIEQWGDARAYDGSASIIQPPIGPLYNTVHSEYELLAAMLNDDRSPYEILRTYWETESEAADFEAFWRRSLHDGVVADSAPDVKEVSIQGGFAQQIADIDLPGNSGLEIIFRADPSLWDGRFAGNSWLQELPRPITKLTWDNAALMSAATAENLSVANEDLIELRYNDNVMLAPVWIVPGHPDDSITVNLGYGLGLSADLEAGRSFNAYALRSSAGAWFDDGLQVSSTDESYPLAAVRPNTDYYEEAEPIFATTLSAFNNDPNFIPKPEKATLLEDYAYEDYAWGMTIDLTSCIGCNACIISCQTENNIPTVGKDAVRRSREMHWIRVDRYYIDENQDGDAQTIFQPVPCMHCEKAPCEQVCPVAATVHDSEGINTMVYNRCIGTRYCSANCPYSVRRFNFMQYIDDDETALNEEYRNPDVTVRVEGVMEKCTYCLQRINQGRIKANNENRLIADGEIMPACATSCPTQAISFGNINDPEARVTREKALPHNYDMLADLNVKPRTSYLARISNTNDAINAPAEEE